MFGCLRGRFSLRFGIRCLRVVAHLFVNCYFGFGLNFVVRLFRFEYLFDCDIWCLFALVGDCFCCFGYCCDYCYEF